MNLAPQHEKVKGKKDLNPAGQKRLSCLGLTEQIYEGGEANLKELSNGESLSEVKRTLCQAFSRSGKGKKNEGGRENANA